MAEQPVGVVTHWFGRLGVATVKLQAPLAVGERVHIKGQARDFVARVRSMQHDHKPLERAEPGMEVGIRVPRRAREGDVVLRAGAAPWWARLLGR